MYSNVDPPFVYQSSKFSRQYRLDDGIDAKVVIMGSTGAFLSLYSFFLLGS